MEDNTLRHESFTVDGRYLVLKLLHYNDGDYSVELTETLDGTFAELWAADFLDEDEAIVWYDRVRANPIAYM